MHIFQKTFLTPWRPAKQILSHPYTLFAILKIPKDTLNWRTTSKKKYWTKFWRNLGPSFDSQKAKSWTKFWLYNTHTHTHIYIYIYTHTYICIVKTLAKFVQFQSWNPGQGRVEILAMCLMLRFQRFQQICSVDHSVFVLHFWFCGMVLWGLLDWFCDFRPTPLWGGRWAKKFADS